MLNNRVLRRLMILQKLDCFSVNNTTVPVSITEYYFLLIAVPVDILVKASSYKLPLKLYAI